MQQATKKPDDGGTSNPAEANLYRNNTTKEQIVSMLEQSLRRNGLNAASIKLQYNALSEFEFAKVTLDDGRIIRVDSRFLIRLDDLMQTFT